MATKTATDYEATSCDNEIATSDVAPILDIVTFMKQPITEMDFLDEELNYLVTCLVLCMFSSTRNGQLTNILHIFIYRCLNSF